MIPGGLFLFMRSFLCGVILCQILAVLALCCLSSGQLGLGRMEADDIAVDIIEAAEAWLNSYPRKMFGFLCSEQLFREELALILAR